MSPRPSRPRTAALAFTLLTAGLAAAQQPIPIPMPPSAAEFQRLSAAAKAQAPAAAPPTELKRLALAASLQPAAPGLVAPAAPAASRAMAIESLADRLKLQYGLQPGTPKYSNALQDQLLLQRVRQYGPPVSGPRFVPVAPQRPDPSSVTTTAAYQRNFPVWLQQTVAGRIAGGNPTPRDEFPDCVALVGSCANYGGCTGTVIGKNVVLTAAHCVRDGCPQQVFIGDDTRAPSRGKFVPVKRRIPHPEYDPDTFRHDIAVVILDGDADVTLPGVTSAGGPVRVVPREIATTADVNKAETVELVGFGGQSPFSPFGLRSQVLVTVSSRACTAREDEKFRCNAGTELVAGGNGQDTCDGDSGGPAYVRVGAGYKLAAVTSRKTGDSTRECGDGGIYTRADAYYEWIVRTATANGGRFR